MCCSIIKLYYKILQKPVSDQSCHPLVFIFATNFTQYLGHPWTAINGPAANKYGVRFYFHLCGTERIFNWKFRRGGAVGTGGGSVVTSSEDRAGPSCFDCLTCKKVDECAAEDQVLFDSIL